MLRELKKLFCKHDTELCLVNKKYYMRLQIRRCTKCGKWFEYDKFEDRLTPIDLDYIDLDAWAVPEEAVVSIVGRW